MRRAAQGRRHPGGCCDYRSGGHGQDEFELRREGGRRPADENDRVADLRRDDVTAGRDIDVGSQGSRDCAQRGSGRAHSDRMRRAVDSEAPGVVGYRVAAQRDDDGRTGHRRGGAVGVRLQPHHGAGFESDTAALGDVQRRAVDKCREAVRRPGVDGQSEGAPDLVQGIHDHIAATEVHQRADRDRILRAVDGHDPAIASHRRAGHIEGARDRGLPGGGNRGRRCHRHRYLEGGCDVTQLEHRPGDDRGHEIVGDRIGGCVERQLQSGSDRGQRVAGPDRVADRRQGRTDREVQYPVLAGDDRAGECDRRGHTLRHRSRRDGGRGGSAYLNGKVVAERHAGAIDDDQRRTLGSRGKRRRPGGGDGGRETCGNFGQGRQPQARGRQVAVGIDQGDRVAHVRGDPIHDQWHAPDFARDRRAGERQRDRGRVAATELVGGGRGRRNHRHGSGEGRCGVAQHEAGAGNRGIERDDERIGGCVDRLLEAGGDCSERRIAGLGRVAHRSDIRADRQVEHPPLADDHRAGERDRARRDGGRARGANMDGEGGREGSAGAVHDGEHRAFGHGAERRRAGTRDRGGQARGDLLERRACGEAVLDPGDGDEPALARDRRAGQRQRNPARRAAIDGDGAARNAAAEADAERDRRPNRVRRTVGDHHGVADCNREVVRQGVDPGSQTGCQLRKRGAGDDAEALTLAGEAEGPGIAGHQRAGEHRDRRGALQFIDCRRRGGGTGDELEQRLKALAGRIDDDHDGAVGQRGEVGHCRSGRVVDGGSERRSDALHGRRYAGVAHLHREAIHAVAGADRDLPVIAGDRRAGEFDQRGRRRRGVDGLVGDAHGVDPGRGLDADRLHFGNRRHAETCQRRSGQHAGAASRCGAVIHVQGVVARAADDGQQRAHGAEQVRRRRHQVRRRLAADPYLVGAVTGIDGGVAVDGLDVDVVIAGAGRNVGAAGVGRNNLEGIVAAAQFDVEDLEVAVDDPARQRAAGDDRIAAHAEAGQVVGSEDAHVIGGAVAVVDVEGIHLRRLFDAGVQVDRPVEVFIAGKRRAELAGFDDRDLADRRHLDGGDEALVGEVDDEHPRAFGDRREGDHPAGDNAVGQFPRQVGQRLARCNGVGMRGGEGGIVEDDGPYLAGEKGRGLQVDQSRLARTGGAGHIGKAEARPGAIDDKQGRAVGDGGEVLRRIDVDGRGERPDDVDGRVSRPGRVAVLGGNVADQQQQRVGHARSVGSGRQGDGGGRSLGVHSGDKARVCSRVNPIQRRDGAAASIHDQQRAALGGRRIGGSGTE